MPENPHDREDLSQTNEKLSEEKENDGENGASSEDRKKRSYYYDDACGYEIYNADDAEEDED